MRICWLACSLLLACGAPASGEPNDSGGGGSDAQSGGQGAAGGADPTTTGAGGEVVTPEDGDGDGIADATEAELAASYFPFLSIHPDDGCPLHGVVYRLAPHPDDAQKVMIWYDVLYQNDCGLNGHVGDNEVFAALVDPSVAAPEGILALRAISHQGTPCERITTCGRLAGCAACAEGPRGGAMFPAVFSSKSKHGGYVDEGSCDANLICDFGGCALAAIADEPQLVNAGEPGAPLTNDLTASGLIVESTGWTEPSLWAFDPWGDLDFGSAGNVRDDLQDAAFLISPNGC